MLASAPLTLAVAESVTCGSVQACIGLAPGASAYFLGGITAYSLDEKVRHLGVNRRRARAVDCVSAEVAEQMARGACALFRADVAVATTGYAEPLPERGVSHPFGWWAVALRGKRGRWTVRHGRKDCPGASRTRALEQIAHEAIATLIRFLSD
jgi:nicotinamide-nucleotide amidase